MLSFIAATLISFSPTAEYAPRFCSEALPFPSPPANAPVLIMTPTGDSVSDGRYVLKVRGFARPTATDNDRGRVVYGQVLNLKTVEGPDKALIGAARKVVVVWWTQGIACEDYFPLRALRATAGEIFVLSRVRPTNEWINGLPTFDMRHSDWQYVAPENPGATAMSITEYRKFFDLLRPPGAVERLLAWAASNPLDARKSPAAGVVCFARAIASSDPNYNPKC